MAAEALVLVLRRRSRLCRARLVLSRVETRGFWRSRRVVAVAHLGHVSARYRVDVHGHEDRSRLEQLDLLMLGYEELGGELPFRRVFPAEDEVRSANDGINAEETSGRVV